VKHARTVPEHDGCESDDYENVFDANVKLWYWREVAGIHYVDVLLMVSLYGWLIVGV
jgi:hypothetical protein